jgi:hypothetical protein
MADIFLRSFTRVPGPDRSRCAGSQCEYDKLYVEVSPSDDMQAAMKALVIKAANANLRLAS